MTNIAASASSNPLETLIPPPRIPRATYRVQFNAQFTFEHARAIVPYLARLGISHLYASPILQAHPDSTHGYDTSDYSRLNEQLGTDADFEALVAELHAHDMGLIVDMVPNHMGIGTAANQWWMDVLENGPSSVWAPVFDIAWQPVKAELANKVLLPILDRQYGEVIESGKITLVYRDGAFFIGLNGAAFPVTPDSYNMILNGTLEHLDDKSSGLDELQSIMTALSHLPSYTDRAGEKIVERNREKEIAKRRLARLTSEHEAIATAIDRAIETFNGVENLPESFDLLDALLAAQPYRFASFRVAGDEINYRRFFNINDMAAIRVEREDVFDAVHQRVVRMIADGQVDGLRIDHPDGLWDPATYFRRLQALYIKTKIQAAGGAVTEDELQRRISAYLEAPSSATSLPFYVIVEKILSETEPLPHDWQVYGTTGYDFLSLVNNLFVDTRSEKRMTEIYATFIQSDQRYADLIYSAKLATMGESLASEINALGHELERITERSRRYRDFTLNGLRRALREVIASMSVYRTYVTHPETVTDRDREYILLAVNDARRRNPTTLRSLLTFVRDTLLLRNLDQFQAEGRDRIANFVMKFQQMTGPVMAKSVEDTVFYVYNRLISLNEVGGHPDQFGLTVEHFHEQNQRRAAEWPHAMLASSTHDTKRSEDVRARINVLSEMPDSWEAAVFRWGEMNLAKKSRIGDSLAPDANDEYLYYQTLLGVWDAPDIDAGKTLRERLHAYMLKALNEAKVNTSWINPNEEYVAAVDAFINQTLDDPTFISSFLAFQQPIGFYGKLNGLSQTLLKLTATGVPDIYQGTELWDLSLVDPDNRRPVDYALRQQLLADIGRAGEQDLIERHVPQLVNDADDGRIKLYLIEAALNLRRQYPDVFGSGSYEPLTVSGRHSTNVCAFARHHAGRTIVVAVPRLVADLLERSVQVPLGENVWGDTRLHLPDHIQHLSYRNALTGETISLKDNTVRLAELLNRFPAALLVDI